jgi:kynurenine formamidase
MSTKEAGVREGPLAAAGDRGFKVIDLSITLKDDPSPFIPAKVTNVDHEAGARAHQEILGVDPQDWPWPGNSAGDDYVEASSHASTHMDAPIHYGPWTIPDKKRPLTIEEWPLEWCLGDGVVLDVRDVPDGYEVSPEEVQEQLTEIDYELKPLDIVLVMTGNDRYWDKPEYLTRGGHLGREALKWILEQGVKVVGTDSWSFDRPGPRWAEDYRKNNRDSKYLWPCHVLGMEMPYAHIEKMTNLDLLPRKGFTVIALPIKVHQGSGGFVRAAGLVSTSD